jgi:CheY-like chemotaxis protein
MTDGRGQTPAIGELTISNSGVHPLDHVIWSALTSCHRDMAEGDRLALRYLAPIAPFAATTDVSAASFQSLLTLLPADDPIGLFTLEEIMPPSPNTNYQNARRWKFGFPQRPSVSLRGNSPAQRRPPTLFAVMTEILGHLCVAVIDDDESQRRALARLLRAAGMQSTAYASAEELFRSDLKQSQFHCLVVDIQLPGMSGIELRDPLAAEGVATPVLFLTAYDDPKVRERALAGPSVGYFRKTACGSEILEAIY